MTECACCCLFTLAPTDGLSFLNEDGGLRVFFPRNSFVSNTTLTNTNTPRNMFQVDNGNDHIACYGGNPKSAQVTWHNSGGGTLELCRSGTTPVPCEGCGPTCERNGAVGVDPSLNGHTSIHLFTDDPNYVNQDLQCRVNGDQSAFIGVYVMNGGGFRSTHNSNGYNMSSCYNLSAKQCLWYSIHYCTMSVALKTFLVNFTMQ